MRNTYLRGQLWSAFYSRPETLIKLSPFSPVILTSAYFPTKVRIIRCYKHYVLDDSTKAAFRHCATDPTEQSMVTKSKLKSISLSRYF